jgi:hypothetical protein
MSAVARHGRPLPPCGVEEAVDSETSGRGLRQSSCAQSEDEGAA